MRKKTTKTVFLFATVLLLAFSNPQTLWSQCELPVLYNLPQAATFIKCGSALPTWASVTASDLCTALPVTTQEFKAGTRCGNVFYERHWSATNGTGTTTFVQTIRYIDEKAPSLTIPKDTTIYCGNAVPKPSYKSHDDCCSWNEVTVKEVRTTHNACEYTLVRTYKATDGCNNSVQKSQTIKVVDKKAPVIKVVNPELKHLAIGDEMEMYDCESPQVFMSDVLVTDCCSKFTVKPYDRLLIHGRCDDLGYFRKWRCGYIATDDAGNKSEFYFFVIQYDTTAPVLHNVPADITLECGDTIPDVDLYLVKAEDNCSRRTKPHITQESFGDPNDSDNQAVRRTWSYTDDCGNSVSASQLIMTCDFDTTLLNTDTTDTDTTGTNAAGLIGSAGTDSEAGSKTRSIARSTSNNIANIHIYPNPTSSDTNLEFQVGENGSVQITLFDKLGKVLQQNTKDLDTGTYLHQIDLSNYPSGVYSLTIVSGNEIKHSRILKTN